MTAATAEIGRAAHPRAAAPAAIVPLVLNDEEIARRREATLKRMLATPHMPHATLGTLRRRKPGKS